MSRTRMTICCFLLATATGAAAQSTVSETKLQTGTGDWCRPDFFPILPWDAVHGVSEANGIESIAACGFTIAGFVRPEDLPACERLGLKAIVAPLHLRSPFARGGWKNVTDAQIDDYVRNLVEASRKSPAVIGYYIVDEPGAPAFPALRKAVEAVRQHAPGKLAYINLFPGYATIGAPDQSQLGTQSFTEYLERYVAEVHPQFISYDNYMVQYSDDLQNTKATANYFRDLLEVRRVALEHNLPFWNIVSSNQIRPVTPPPSPANLLLQAYTTLAAGGRGVSWYKYYAGGYAYAPVDKQGLRTETWGYLRAVNEQVRVIGPLMNDLRSTGVFFSSPVPVETGRPLPGSMVAAIEAKTSLRSPDDTAPPLMVGEFAGADGTGYAMVVNLSLARSVNVKPRLHAGDRGLSIISAVDGRIVPFDAQNGHWIVPGGGVLMRISAQSAASQPSR